MMYISTKNAARRRKSSSGLMAAGVGTITLDQRMTLAKRTIADGSIRSDWKKVGKDIESAIRNARRQLERA